MRCRFLSFVIVALVASTALPAIAQDKKTEAKKLNLYPLAKGTKWEYEVKVMGQTLEATQEITDVSKPKEGERAVSTISSNVAGQMITEEMSVDEKAIYRHAMNGQKLDTPIVTIKYPYKAGSKWTEKLKFMGADVEAEFEAKATEKIKVAAGEYSAYPVVMTIKTMGQTINATNWYADGVGIVKQQMEIGPLAIVMELTKFTAAK